MFVIGKYNQKSVDFLDQFAILHVLIKREKIMLKYENLAEVGMVIRGYDFRGSKGAYLEGKVIAKGEIRDENGRYHFDGYTIMVETDGAEFGREGEEAYIPFETSMDYDGRVELIDTCDNDAEIALAIQMMQEVA
jgi:hypothetical protein